LVARTRCSTGARMGAGTGGAAWAAISAGDRIVELANQVTSDDRRTAPSTTNAKVRRLILICLLGHLRAASQSQPDERLNSNGAIVR
jgi:hypothetical protein